MNKRYEKYKTTYAFYRKKNKKRNYKLSQAWRLKNKTHYNLVVREPWFGHNLRNVLERDEWMCVICGTNNEQHIVIFGRAISVDHIDGDRKNNDMSNLQTLCLRCHGKKDVQRRSDFKRKKKK